MRLTCVKSNRVSIQDIAMIIQSAMDDSPYKTFVSIKNKSSLVLSYTDFSLAIVRNKEDRVYSPRRIRTPYLSYHQKMDFNRILNECLDRNEVKCNISAANVGWIRLGHNWNEQGGLCREYIKKPSNVSRIELPKFGLKLVAKNGELTA